MIELLTTKEAESLKRRNPSPCPICGYGAFGFKSNYRYFVGCSYKHCSAPAGNARTLKAAVEMWNKIATGLKATLSPEMVAAIRKREGAREC